MASLRRIVYAKTNGYCGYCGEWVDENGKWEIEHIHPRSKGGSDRMVNLLLACQKCNRQKGTKSSMQFRQWIRRDIIRRIEEAIELIEKFGVVEMDKPEIDYTSSIVADLMNACNTLEPDPFAEDHPGTSPMIKFMADSIWEKEWQDLLRQTNDPVETCILYQQSRLK